MSDLLGTGASALRAYSRALGTIGDNIANAQTPGFARRTLALREMPGSGNTVLIRPHIRASGVEVAGVTRATDAWLQSEARLASGEGERASAQLARLTNVELVLADAQNGIAIGLTSLFTTADMLTADPGNTTLRAQFLGAADTVASGFRGTAARLSGLASANAAAVVDETAGLNIDLAALADVNLGLRKARPGSIYEAGLLDERDRLLDQLAARMDVSASFGKQGTVILRAASSGAVLVDHDGVRGVAATVAGDGRVAFSIAGNLLGIASGSLAGIAAAAHHIADQRSDLDHIAVTIAQQMNAAHQYGFDANGAAGSPLFSAANSAATLEATPLAPHAVAAAGGGRDNGNMLAIAALRGSGGPESLWADFQAGQGQATALARAQESAASARFESAGSARDAVSAIDLDREAADLIRFQQAYTAAAQTIQIARETMQALFSAI